MRSLPVFVVVALVSSATSARAQADFSALPIHVGDRVYVITSSGAEVGGRITTHSPTTLSIDEFEFTPETALRIERPGDSLLNGALIGFAVGAFVGAGLYQESCAGTREPCPSRAVMALGAGASEAAFGAFLDWLHVGRRQIYRRTAPGSASTRRVAPFITPRGKGVALAFSF